MAGFPAISSLCGDSDEMDIDTGKAVPVVSRLYCNAFKNVSCLPQLMGELSPCCKA